MSDKPTFRTNPPGAADGDIVKPADDQVPGSRARQGWRLAFAIAAGLAIGLGIGSFDWRPGGPAPTLIAERGTKAVATSGTDRHSSEAVPIRPTPVDRT